MNTLERANRLIGGDRQADYGPPDVNFQRIADGWNLILDQQLTCQITPGDVVLMMCWLKSARLIASPGHYDSWVDLAGYAGIGGDLLPKPTSG